MNAYILALMKRPDRRLNVYYLEKELRSYGIKTIIVEATDRADKEFRHIPIAMNPNLTAAEICCAWGHHRIYRMISELGKPALVIEDDALLLRDPRQYDFSEVEHYGSLSAYDPNNSIEFEFLERGKHFDRTKGCALGTQMYYLTPNGAEILTNLAIPIRWASDIAPHDLSWHGRFTTHLAKLPGAVQHPVIHSHIGER